MSPEQLAWSRYVKAGDVLATIEGRLTQAGGIVELRQMQGMSAQETSVLIAREVTGASTEATA